MDDTSILTIGLLLFAAAQVWVQYRNEETRTAERQFAANEAMDRAFHIAWAEHFRLEGLAGHLGRADLIELAVLGVLKPEDVLPRDWGKITEALSSLSREAGYLGGVAITMAFDIERQIGIFVSSVLAFAAAAPDKTEMGRVLWVRKHHQSDLESWETSIRASVDQLSRLYWDAASHNARVTIERQLEFSENLSSDFAKAAVGALVKRSKALANPKDE